MVEEKLTYIMMVPIHNLHGEYGHCTVKQTYKNVLNNVVKVTNALSFNDHPLHTHHNYGGYLVM